VRKDRIRNESDRSFSLLFPLSWSHLHRQGRSAPSLRRALFFLSTSLYTHSLSYISYSNPSQNPYPLLIPTHTPSFSPTFPPTSLSKTPASKNLRATPSNHRHPPKIPATIFPASHSAALINCRRPEVARSSMDLLQKSCPSESEACAELLQSSFPFPPGQEHVRVFPRGDRGRWLVGRVREGCLAGRVRRGAHRGHPSGGRVERTSNYGEGVPV